MNNYHSMQESCIHQSCNTAELLPSTVMRGILDLDVLCLTKIFKFLKPLDFCSLRQSCTQLRDFVDLDFHSVYHIREKSLDLTAENTGNINRILRNFGKYIRHLKIRQKGIEPKLPLDVIFNNCGGMLKSLSLNGLRLYEIDMKKFAGVLNGLEILELFYCDGTENSFKEFMLVNEYPNLTTLKMNYTDVSSDIIKTFFSTKRKIKKLNTGEISGDILPLIVKNAPEIEELTIYPENSRNLMSLIQLRKLRRLEISSETNFYEEDLQEPIIALIKELSINNSLETLGLISDEFTDEYCHLFSNLVNLKHLRLLCGNFRECDTKSLEILCLKLSKLESLSLHLTSEFPYRNFLASACKSDKFRTIYVKYSDWHEFIYFFNWLLKDFVEGRGQHCFVSGDPLCIYVYERYFDFIQRRDHIESIEKYGNIKILQANRDAFEFDI